MHFSQREKAFVTAVLVYSVKAGITVANLSLNKFTKHKLFYSFFHYICINFCFNHSSIVDTYDIGQHACLVFLNM